MKKIKQFILIVIIMGFALPSCKKGENDPFLSLRSRKARITGEWKLSSGTTNYILNDTTKTTIYNGTTATSPTGTFPYTEKWTINKNGTLTLSIHNSGDVFTMEANWCFGDKVKEMDLKNKESIIIWATSKKWVYYGGTTTDNETYSGTSCPMYSLTIDKLKNKEMDILIDGASTWLTNSNSETGIFHYTQE